MRGSLINSISLGFGSWNTIPKLEISTHEILTIQKAEGHLTKICERVELKSHVTYIDNKKKNQIANKATSRVVKAFTMGSSGTKKKKKHFE